MHYGDRYFVCLTHLHDRLDKRSINQILKLCLFELSVTVYCFMNPGFPRLVCLNNVKLKSCEHLLPCLCIRESYLETFTCVYFWLTAKYSIYPRVKFTEGNRHTHFCSRRFEFQLVTIDCFKLLLDTYEAIFDVFHDRLSPFAIKLA